MTDVLTVALGAIAFAGVLGGLGYLAWRHTLATLGLQFALWIATAALRDNVGLSVVVSGVRVSALDLLCVALAAVGIARILQNGVQNLARGLALALFVLLALHIARGMLQFGVQAAANDSRTWFYFTSALLYAATVPGGWGRDAWKIVVGTGLLLTVVAVPYILIEGLSSANDVLTRNGEVVRASPILATGALVILQSAILAPAIRWPSTGSSKYVAVAAGLIVLLLQYRTVWAAGFLVALFAGFWWYKRRAGLTRAIAIVGGGAIVVLASVAILAAADVGPIGDSARSATISNSTFTWRFTGWRELLDSHDSPSNLATGQPSGGSFARVINGNEVNVSAHNELVEAYIRFGIAGIICLVALAWVVWSRRAEVAERANLKPETVALLLLSQIVFSLAYGLDLAQGAVAGILVSGISTAPVPVRNLRWPRKGTAGAIALGNADTRP